MATIKGINVGTTDITSTYVNGNTRNDTKELEVTALDLGDVSGSVSSPGSSVYTGSAQTPTPQVTVVLDGVVTILEINKDYTLSYSNNVNVGTATVTATGTGNYTGSISSTWSITGATMTVVANDQSYVYDGNRHGSAISVTTVNSQTPTIRYRTSSSGEYGLTSAPQIKNVSQSGTVYFKVTAPNHLDYTGTYQLEISALTATLVWGTTSWVYDGEEHSTTCVVDNLIGNDTCSVTLSGNSITNIGSTTVTATALSNSNYTLPSVVTQTITVLAGMFIKVSGTWTPVKKAYKKVSGSWVLQELGSVFDTNKRYIKGN